MTAPKRKTTKKAAPKGRKKKAPAKATSSRRVTNKQGRPSKFRDDMLRQAQAMARHGMTDQQIAEVLGVSHSTLNNWKHDVPGFLDSLNEGKAESDARVVRSLFERATGYSHPEDKIFQYEGAPIVVPTTKHYPPDTTACIFWLKNRRPNDWQDKVEQKVEHTGVRVIIGGDA